MRISVPSRVGSARATSGVRCPDTDRDTVRRPRHGARCEHFPPRERCATFRDYGRVELRSVFRSSYLDRRHCAFDSHGTRPRAAMRHARKPAVRVTLTAASRTAVISPFTLSAPAVGIVDHLDTLPHADCGILAGAETNDGILLLVGNGRDMRRDAQAAGDTAQRVDRGIVRRISAIQPRPRARAFRRRQAAGYRSPSSRNGRRCSRRRGGNG